MRTLQDAIALGPQNASAHLALGLAPVRQKLYQEPLDQLAQATRLAPGDARFSNVYGIALKSLGKRDESRAIIRDALERHPWDGPLLNAMPGEALENGDTASAAPLAERLAALHPDDPDFARLAAKLAGQ
jgi:Flp pilus assembly protein TadD